ncbi:MAG: sodium:proton antiporter [Lachnospiraceae bacterium]|nr:sodium:proton antiporter [Lachnospiraceae bacterium]
MSEILVIFDNFANFALIVLAALSVLCLVRAVKGPRPADRIVAANMLGTLTMAMIVLLLDKLHEGYLADIALIYALISFLAVVVLCKVYTGAYKTKKKEEDQNGNN